MEDLTVTARGYDFAPAHAAMQRINCQVENRLRKHLRRRSQPPWRIPEGSTLLAHLRQLGLVRL